MVSKIKWFKSFRLKQINEDFSNYLDNLKNDALWIQTKDAYAKYGIKLAYKYDDRTIMSLNFNPGYDLIPSILIYNENNPADYTYIGFYDIDNITKADELVSIKLKEMNDKLNKLVTKYNEKEEFVILNIFSFGAAIYKDKEQYVFHSDFLIDSFYINDITYAFLKQNKTSVLNFDMNDLVDQGSSIKIYLGFKSNYILDVHNNIIRTLPIKLKDGEWEYLQIEGIVIKKDGSYMLDDQEFTNNLRIRLDIANNKPISNLIFKKEKITTIEPIHYVTKMIFEKKKRSFLW